MHLNSKNIYRLKSLTNSLNKQRMSSDLNNHDFKDEDDDQNFEGENVEVIEQNYGGEEGDEEDLAEEMIEMNVDDFIEMLENQEENDQDIEEIEDNSVFTLNKHQGAVFCIDSFNNLLATGGEDDKAYIWNLKSEINNNSKLDIELQFETEKFADSVTNVKFSCDGKYLAVSDMSGKIKVYVSETKELFWSHDIEMDLETLNWHPSCNVLFCSTNEGYFMMFKISTNEIKLMYFGDNTILSCFRILKDGKRAACCYNNGNVRIIDLKTGQPEFNILNAHESDILCMDVSGDGNLLATGGTDMKIQIINTINGKIVGKFQVPIPKEKLDEEENSIESVGFCKTQALISCVTLNGQMYVWDLNTHVLRNHLENKEGFSKILWNDQELLYASTLDGCVLCYDGRNLELIKKFSGHQSEILDFCFNKDYLFTASNDNCAKIFKINQ